MTTFLLVENNETDLFVHEKVLKLLGFDKVKSFKTISESWHSVKAADTKHVVIFVDVQSILREDWLTLSKPKEFTGKLDIYVVDVIINEDIKLDLRNFQSIKGFIEKPLTVYKVKEIMGMENWPDKSCSDAQNWYQQRESKNVSVTGDSKTQRAIL